MKPICLLHFQATKLFKVRIHFQYVIERQDFSTLRESTRPELKAMFCWQVYSSSSSFCTCSFLTVSLQFPVACLPYSSEQIRFLL